MASKTGTTSGKSLDLGNLQKEVENATRNLKATNTALKKAQDAQANAEATHATLLKAMSAAILQFQAATKVA